jgi:hypothetical protein
MTEGDLREHHEQLVSKAQVRMGSPRFEHWTWRSTLPAVHPRADAPVFTNTNQFSQALSRPGGCRRL